MTYYIGFDKTQYVYVNEYGNYKWSYDLVDPHTIICIDDHDNEPGEEWAENCHKYGITLITTITPDYPFTQFKQDHPEFFI